MALQKNIVFDKKIVFSVGKNILEKDVTLLIARELERTLKNTYGYKPVMIRPDDRYVGLDDRYQNARKLGADLFVSVHADGFRLSSVKGASVYVWSEEASSITAATLSKNKLTSSPEVKSKIGKLDVRDFDEDAARTLSPSISTIHALQFPSDL